MVACIEKLDLRDQQVASLSLSLRVLLPVNIHELLDTVLHPRLTILVKVCRCAESEMYTLSRSRSHSSLPCVPKIHGRSK